MVMVSRLLDLPFFETAKAIKAGNVAPGSTIEPLTKKDHETYDY